MARHWDTYDEVDAYHPSPDDGTTISVHRGECSPYEWKLLVEDAQNHKWWEENMIRWGNRDHIAYPRANEIATLSLCLACMEFMAIETEGTAERIFRCRCLDCGAITMNDLDHEGPGDGYWLDGNGGVVDLKFSVADALAGKTRPWIRLRFRAE